jgi:hypothetical protein
MTETVQPLDDIVVLEREAQGEVDEERRKAAKAKIASSLRQIRDAKRVLANLELAHRALLDDLREGI